MLYIIYKITNVVNNKIYIGKHKTSNINDSYMGSGKLIIRAISKYGIESFNKEILHVFDNSEEMDKCENEIVNEDFISRTDVYNLKLGGYGGWDYINSNNLNKCVMTDEIRDKLSNAGKRGAAARIKRLKCEKYYKEYSLKLSKAIKKYYSENESHWTGRKHKTESKIKIGKASAIHQIGEGNSQFGSRWIYDASSHESVKIKKGEDVPEGWVLGRKMKRVDLPN